MQILAERTVSETSYIIGRFNGLGFEPDASRDERTVSEKSYTTGHCMQILAERTISETQATFQELVQQKRVSA